MVYVRWSRGIILKHAPQTFFYPGIVVGPKIFHYDGPKMAAIQMIFCISANTKYRQVASSDECLYYLRRYPIPLHLAISNLIQPEEKSYEHIYLYISSTRYPGTF